MRIRTAVATLATTAGLIAGPAAPAAQARDTGPGRQCSPLVSIGGYSDALDKTTFQGTFVGNLSALAVRRDGRIAALSDRSQLFTLGPLHRPERVVALADPSGRPLDSEGLAVERDGSYLVASETEPSVRRFGGDGTPLASLPVPQELRLAPAGRGRPNQTFEGLTLGADGRLLTAAMEGPLTGEGTDSQGRELVRFQTWRRSGGGDFRLARQYAYPLDRGLNVAETAALADGRLLVLERGFTAGVGNTVRLQLADPRRAGRGRPMPKRLLADLGDCPSLGAPAKQPQANPLLDNIEAMAVVGRARDKGLRLLLASDDNQSPTQITRLYELSVRLPARGTR